MFYRLNKLSIELKTRAELRKPLS